MKLNDSILKTLAYSNYFDFPLMLGELHTRLIQSRATLQELKAALLDLQSKRQIFQKDKYYYLAGRAELVGKRQAKAHLAVHKIQLAQNRAKELGQIPGVVAVFLTGALAVHNSPPHDDIDFMLITRSQQLWLTRLFATLYTELKGIRRHPDSQNRQDTLCLNLYLTVDSLTLQQSKRTLYTAYELIQAVPLYDPEDLASQLLLANSWVKHLLPNFPLPKSRPLSKTPRTPTWLSFIDKICYFLERRYMQGKITREIISREVAFFHPQDREGDIIKSCSTQFLPLSQSATRSTRPAKKLS